MSGKTPTVVSILNLKGGVGKTTVAAMLARYASGTGGYNMTEQKNLDVLAVDLDPQANLSQALMGEKAYSDYMKNEELSIVELFDKGYAPPSADCASPTKIKMEQVIKKVSKSNYGTGNLEILPSRFDFADNLIDSINRADKTVLAKFISEHMMHKDLIIIDCAPTQSILTWAAYHASRYVLIPVRPEFFATIGFPLMHKSLQAFKAKNPKNCIEICGVLFNHNLTEGKSKKGTPRHQKDAYAEIHAFAHKHEWPVLYNEMYFSEGFQKLMESNYISNPGKVYEIWNEVADEILQSIGLEEETWHVKRIFYSKEYRYCRKKEDYPELLKLRENIMESAEDIVKESISLWKKQQKINALEEQFREEIKKIIS